MNKAKFVWKSGWLCAVALALGCGSADGPVPAYYVEETGTTGSGNPDAAPTDGGMDGTTVLHDGSTSDTGTTLVGDSSGGTADSGDVNVSDSSSGSENADGSSDVSVDGSGTCTSNTDCPSGQMCDQGTCRNPGGGCTSDMDCAPDICVAGRCVPADDGGSGSSSGSSGGSSSGSSGSSGGTTDSGSSGSSGGSSSGGTTDSGSSSDGSTCNRGDSGSGGGHDGCTSNADCPSPQVCDDGRCVCDGDDNDGRDKVCKHGKTLVCHYPPGNTENRHEICVGTPSVPAHLDHGDTLGPCP